MKLTYKSTVALLIGIVMCYSACKKMNTAPKSTSTTDYSALSSQIALNLVRSLSGKYGGTNINDGIKAPSSISSSHHGLSVLDVTSLCGFTIDTTFNTKTTVADTAKSLTGNFKFVYTCDTSVVNGYTVHDSLTDVETGALFSNTFIVGQDYTVKALDQTYKLVSMDGTILSSVVNNILSGTATTGYHKLITNYTLKGLNVSFTSGTADVTTGTATFAATTADLDSTTPTTGTTGSYSGSIQFSAGHKAVLTLTINGTTTMYNVNLITGATTAV